LSDAKHDKEASPAGIWLRGVTVASDTFPVRDCYPFDVPAFCDGAELHFCTPVVFFVGENGSGKTTLLEAIVRAAGIHIWGVPSRRHVAHRNPHETALGRHLVLDWTQGPVSGGLFSAETFREWADFLDDVALADPGQLRYFGGRTLTDQSHGQGLLTYFGGRYRYRGLYFLDEPEAALSPSSQLALLRLLHDLRGEGHAQFVVATHSPLLLALPGAQIFSFTEGGVAETVWQQTAHYRLYRDFLADPEAFLPG